MNTLKIARQIKFSLALGAVLALSACSGDGRPLEEAVETSQLDLEAISIVQPTGLLDDLFVNPGEQINFSIMAITDTGAEIPLSVADRRWSVDNTSLATIDGNGKFIGTADGVVNVSVQIGGLTDSFPVTIAEGVLDALVISPVESDPIEGDLTAVDDPMGDSLERCLPGMYKAIGTFRHLFRMDDPDTGEPATVSMRGVQNINWSTADPALGSASAQLNGTTSVIAFESGTLDLIAAVGSVSATESISVEDNLLSIDILPLMPQVMVSSTLALDAFGVYGRDNEETSTNITDYVNWSVPTDDSFATVSNDSSSKGLVSGIAIGNASVTAACGGLTMERIVAVIENDGSGSGNLAFEGGPNRTISVGETVQLNASIGPVYDEDAAITFDNETRWTVTEGARFAAFQSATQGLITGLEVGEATIRVLVDGEDEADDAEAFQTIIVE